MSARLRVGVLLDCTRIRAWQHALLARIRDSDYAEIALVVLPEATEQGCADIEPRARQSTLLHALAAGLVESTYLRLERRILCEHDAFAMRDGESLLAGIPRIEASFGLNATTVRYAPEDIQQIRALNLDAFLALGSCAPAEVLGASARYGAWHLDSSDYPRRSGAPPGFWEVYFGHPVTRMDLTISKGDGKCHKLASSSAGTHQLSVKLNRSNAYWNALSLVPRKLAQLHSRGEQALRSREESVRVNTHPAQLEADAAALAIHIIRNIKRRALERFRRTLSVEQWILLFHLGDGLCTRISDFTSIVPPIDRYWADPHVVYRDGKYYIFIEEYSLVAQKGHICVIAIDRHGRHGEAVKILERPYHLSYPFVFEHRGELYMVPESMENKTIELYRCAEFPDKWEFVRNLQSDVCAVDSTLLEHNGKWWLFANMVENQGGSASEELFVFHTNCLLTGSWTPHSSNPVVSDVTSARPAGAIQRRAGKLYRPAQDCSVRYGYAIRINEITAISTEEYAETEVARINPDWDRNILATHTLAYASGLTVVDALLLRPRFGQHH